MNQCSSRASAVCFCLLGVLLSAAQLGATALAPRALPAAGFLDFASLAPDRRLDFMEGNWITSSPGPAGASAPSAWSTSVERALMGQVLTMQSTGALTHFSYLEDAQLWKAVFISPLGDFDTLQGGLRDEKMILDQPIVRGRPEALARTTFYDVQPNSFRSDFESSTDGGETWVVDFAMFYQRTGVNPNDLAPLLAEKSPQASSEVGELDFLLGRWMLDYKIQLPDGSTSHGRGIASVHFDEAGDSIIEDAEALFDSWVSSTSRIVRRWDTGTGVWLVDRSSDHAPQGVRLVARRTQAGLIEERFGPEGELLERISITRVGNQLVTRSERLNRDGSSEPDGLMQVIATRLGALP